MISSRSHLTGSRTYANPFLDVTVKATFTAPSGRTLTAYGFHDGETTWRVRWRRTSWVNGGT